ncbi:MAG: right-handed parallel beta-helix repeat-containing protein [Gaiellales bacterium]
MRVLFNTARWAVLVAAWLAVVPGTARAHGSPLRCGDAITTDTRLTADLTGCTGNGLVIARDGVTVDLAGHRIVGDGSADFAGIDVEGHHDVTIENGAVRGFSEDVLLIGARDVMLRRLTVTWAGHGGVLVDGSRRVTVRGAVAQRCGAGIIVTRSSRIRVVGNRVSHSSSGGIPVFSSTHVLVAGNTVTGSRTDMAIGLVNGTSDSVVRRNRVTRSGAGVVIAEGSSHNLISDNVARNDDGGVILDVGTHDNRVVGNLVERTSFEGIAVVGSDNNVVAWNHVLSSGTVEAAGGIVVMPLPDDLALTSDGNLISENLARHNRGNGITIAGGQTRNVVRGNAAYHNSALGIAAGDGATDGGGNTAAHNGDPRQCVGVAC